MKNLFLGIIGLCVLASCSRDNDREKVDVTPTQPKQTPILLTSRVTTDPNGVNSTFELSYDGEKITQEINKDTGRKTLFLYDGDKIIKLVDSESTLDFSYDNIGRLIKRVTTLHSGIQLEENYTHESKNKIKAERISNGEKYNIIYTLDNDGDVTSIYTTSEDLSFINNMYYEYDYNFYHNPYSNIKGLHNLMLPLSPKKNIKSMRMQTKTTYDGNTNINGFSVTYSYKYNDKKYPTEAYIKHSNNGESKDVFTYNQ